MTKIAWAIEYMLLLCQPEAPVAPEDPSVKLTAGDYGSESDEGLLNPVGFTNYMRIAGPSHSAVVKALESMTGYGGLTYRLI